MDYRFDCWSFRRCSMARRSTHTGCCMKLGLAHCSAMHIWKPRKTRPSQIWRGLPPWAAGAAGAVGWSVTAGEGVAAGLSWPCLAASLSCRSFSSVALRAAADAASAALDAAGSGARATAGAAAAAGGSCVACAAGAVATSGAGAAGLGEAAGGATAAVPAATPVGGADETAGAPRLARDFHPKPIAASATRPATPHIK